MNIMEIMEHNAPKHKGWLIIPMLLLLFTAPLLAQTAPEFSAIDPHNNKKQSLQAFLGSFNHLPLDYCLKATGSVKFKLNKNNKIDIIATEGNLPDTLVNTIKGRIKATEGHWTSDPETADYRKWFVIPVFVDNHALRDCTINTMVSTDLGIITGLFRNRNEIIITSTSYLLYPFDISSIY